MLTHIQSALNALKASDKDSLANVVASYCGNAFNQICARYVQYYKIKDARPVVNPLYEWLQQKVFRTGWQLEPCHYEI